MDRKLKKLEKEQRRLMKQINYDNNPKKKSSPSFLQFLIGLIMLGAGLFWIFQSVYVTSSFHIGGLTAPNGTIIIPLLIGIVMLFLMERKIYGIIIIAIGIVIILISIITSVRLFYHGGNLINHTMMFGLTAVGGGLVLKNLFKK